MIQRFVHPRSRRAHTLTELIVAMIASGVLLAGLGSLMFIGREVAYTPSAAARRTEAADVVGQIIDELQYATLIVGQSPRALEFVVADRNADGTAEKIRYEWSGTVGDPLRKTVNGGAPVTIVDKVKLFDATYLLKPKTSVYTTTAESAEAVLVANTNVQAGLDRDVTATNHYAHQINPAAFAAIPANAISWNATKVEFYSRKSGATNETLLVQLCPTGEPYDQPAGGDLGQVAVSEASISAPYAWNTAVFPDTIRNLALHRKYAVVWSQVAAASSATLLANDSAPSGVLESTDAGASWQYMPTRQMYSRLYGTYNTPGPSYSVTRNFVTHVRIILQTAQQSHARIDASAPLVNVPEQLSAYWRTDFDRNPTAIDGDGDGTADWIMAGGASFDAATLMNGVWFANGALETRPLNNFRETTTVEARCRNSTVGGNGAVMRINADRQSGLYAPLLVYVQRRSDGTQTLSLYGKPSDAATKQLFSRSRLSTDFVRFRLTILPQNNVVNLVINDEDQGTFAYPTYAPSNTTDRYLTLFPDTSLAEFDYVDVRVAN